MRRDDRNVPAHRYHGMRLVDQALAHVTSRVRMDVGKDLQFALRAECPQLGEALAMEDDDALVERAWIKIVIADVVDDTAVLSVPPSEEKGATFVMAAPAPAQITYQAEPSRARDTDGFFSCLGRPRYSATGARAR